MTGTNILCYSASTGAVTANVSGGSGSYSYLWSNGSTASSISGVTAGSYSVTIRDANNSIKTASITLTQSDSLIADASFGTIALPMNTTTVVVSARGGTSPYTGTGSFSGQDTGSHTYNITDANECPASVTIFIPLTPTPMTLGLTPHNTLCYGSTGFITSNVSGGVPPYLYTWFKDGVNISGTDSTLDSLNTVPAGTYTSKIYDSNGDSITATAVVQDAPLLEALESHTPIQYIGGNSTITITSNGGTGSVTGTGTFVRTAGTYDFTVTDANGCTSTVRVTIAEGAQRPTPKKYKFRNQ